MWNSGIVDPKRCRVAVTLIPHIFKMWNTCGIVEGEKRTNVDVPRLYMWNPMWNSVEFRDSTDYLNIEG